MSNKVAGERMEKVKTLFKWNLNSIYYFNLALVQKSPNLKNSDKIIENKEKNMIMGSCTTKI